jgi:hypothetical protein
MSHRHFAGASLDEVEKFLHTPAPWSAAHGGMPNSSGLNANILRARVGIPQQQRSFFARAQFGTSVAQVLTQSLV